MYGEVEKGRERERETPFDAGRRVAHTFIATLRFYNPNDYLQKLDRLKKKYYNFQLKNN